MIISSQVSANEVEEMIEFYRQHFQEVSLVSCSACHAPLALELRGGDPMGMQVNDLGIIVASIGDHLMSSRVRLDETPEGERMMGYQCGAPVDNPDYPKAETEYQAAIKQHEIDHKKWEKENAAHQKLMAKDPEAAGPRPDEPTAPAPHNVEKFLECGNDSRLGPAERGLVPTGRSLIHMSPFEREKIAQQIRESGKKPIFKRRGNFKYLDTFQVERIK